MKKLGCAKCGGMKKMKLGGSAVAKAPVNMYGIPQENMGTSSQMGFGKNASIGKGFFTVSDFEEIKLIKASKTLMTLSPAVLEGQNIRKAYHEPFTRFGKHGADLANKNPFKKPLLLANSGAIVIFEDVYTKAYIGKAIKGHSAHQDTVHQGYAIVIPTKDINQ